MKNYYDETDDITGYWEKRYQAWLENPDWGVYETKDRWFEERFDHLLPPANNPAGGVFRQPIGRVLEFGCGNAMYSTPLLRRFEQYYGMDTSPTALEIARLHYGKTSNRTLRLITDPDEPFRFPDSYFDLVVTITVLQHQPVQRRLFYVDEIKRVLKPGTGRYIGLEWSDSGSQAYDMPPISEAAWRNAWMPLGIDRDIPDAHPEWRVDNVWVTS